MFRRELQCLLVRSGALCSQQQQQLQARQQSGSGSAYVTAVRELEHCKLDDARTLAAFDGGRSVLFANRQVLVRQRTDDTLPMRLRWVHTHELRSLLRDIDAGEVDPVGSSCLLNFDSAAEDKSEQPVGLFGYGLKQLDQDAVDHLEKATDGSFTDLRVAMLASAAVDAQYMSQAQSVLQWCHTFRFCPSCRTQLKLLHSKASAKCTGCQKNYYPTLSPVAQCLIENASGTHCLLVRHLRSPPGMFTAVSGFLEPGETLEEAARREVAEEVGIDVCNASYEYRSQHWPFPSSSLMLPFVVQADMQQPIQLDEKELRDAAWFCRAQVAAAVDNINRLRFDRTETGDNTGCDRFWLVPPAGTSAHQLIVKWLRRARL